ncbi:serine/threonine protein phosphatase 2A 55 kDa regulatory subunit B beta isoform isoform X1 [Cajanus cajan]|uniref:Serine/threonine-protein phosphatase 2A 55 kDa regulatory subunit B n=1 Tax=Cajanus cajan TaxID=3821 RepID=A0A151S9W4_CAJCA|nr:serine/threonine protein phosphatase 2A 55 kDa regulatory subunit B beta isoform isoform X1 [Cajanus cajan]KYP51573.1 Serine/threonine protein phosphatase 2A 55 kDa regulatory subunit B beta isoform [Cajanus cajan]
MTMTDSTSAAPLRWNFSQVLGQRLPDEPLQNDDVVTTVAFEKRGDYLAVGDRGGRVVIFERDDRKKNASNNRRDLEKQDFATTRHPEFRYKTEFQSHEPEFDYLKSVEIEEKINKVRWWMTHNGLLFILSTNDKTIKLWKVKEHKVKQVKEISPPLCSENMLLADRSFIPGLETKSAASGYRLEWIEKTPQKFLQSQDIDGEIGGMEDPFRAKCQKVYACAHSFNINSISNNSDYETLLSADDLRINLWNLEVSDQCFNIIDMKPPNMEDLTEVITSAEFHPLHCNLLAYSSSQGFIRLSDLRHAAICDHASRIFQHGECYGSKSFFTEITSSISDIKFLNDGHHLISRNYMNMKLWDMRMESSPVAIFKIHEHLRPKLPELYNNDCIFDKFECCFSGDGLHFATGSYSNLLQIFSPGSGKEERVKLEIRGNSDRKTIHQATSRVRRRSLSNLIPRGIYQHAHPDSQSSRADFSCHLSSKLLHVAWHPTSNLVACAAESSLVLYYA